jgi:hypothetical protein
MYLQWTPVHEQEVMVYIKAKVFRYPKVDLVYQTTFSKAFTTHHTIQNMEVLYQM